MSKVAASVRARLRNHAESIARPFDEVFQNYALERFLYRLAQSPHADRFVLKGALLFRAWGTAAARPTRDIDLLGFVANEIPLIESMFREVCALPVEDESFDLSSRMRIGRALRYLIWVLTERLCPELFPGCAIEGHGRRVRGLGGGDT